MNKLTKEPSCISKAKKHKKNTTRIDNATNFRLCSADNLDII
ncbi:hypothetical protein N500_0366 [Wolbachia pipientis wUni]|nr:hypothetical protein N500_0366 [Wolbachia pipientis wUni]